MIYKENLVVSVVASQSLGLCRDLEILFISRTSMMLGDRGKVESHADTTNVKFIHCKLKYVLPVKPWVCIGIWNIQDLSRSCHLTRYALLYRKPKWRQTEFSLSMFHICNETEHSHKAAQQVSWPRSQTYCNAIE